MRPVAENPASSLEPTKPETGLTSAEARKRLKEYGPNRLVAARRRPPLVEWLVRPFTDPMVLLLLAAGITYLFLGDFVDAAVVLVAAVPIALVSTILEVRAERALDRLKQLTAPSARVMRDGRQETIPAEELVPGDLVFAQEGDIVPADGVLIAGSQILVDESALTGESLPVTKGADGPDRELYAGTTILNGRGLMRVIETGPRTRFGQIGTLVARIRQPATPLQRLINRLVWQSTVVAAVFCVAVAEGHLTTTEGDRVADECGLEFLGLVAFDDPLRPGVCESLAECRDAGIRVIMVTGDHPVTAHAVAEGLKLPHRDRVATGSELDAMSDAELGRLVEDVDIFARIRPEQKYRLVRTLKARGQVVAMTGDGINDAPALREADIGVAMGQRRTEVAREVADIVLLDDNISTIVVAVRDGRRVFENLRRAFAYLIAFETPLLLGALIIPLIGVPLLLLPPILIWSELIVHPTASLVFENDPAPADLMRRPPRPPGAGLLVTSDFIRSLAQGSLLAGGVLLLYLALLAHEKPVLEARGTALATLLLGQLIVLLSSRSPLQPFWKFSLMANPVLPWVIGVTLASLFVALYVPPIATIVGVSPPSPGEWLLAIVTALVTSVALEPLKSWQHGSTAPP